MCGFTGYFSFREPIDEKRASVLEDLTHSLAHRGPDDAGFYKSDKCILGHRRLSVIDTSERGHQPFLSPDKQQVLIFNGEIYNYLELRRILETEGVAFTGASDTEVLLHWLLLKGKEGVSALNGCFAFALFDRTSHSLLLGRDAMGIKPLYYSKHADGVAFASEARALVQHGKELNKEAISAYLRFSYCPGTSQTVLSDVQKLAPGQLLEITPTEATPLPYFHLSKTFDKESENSPEKLSILLERAVQDRLIADVPVGTFLSGGLDSSLISALAARHHTDLNTFSIGFDNALLNESKYARMVAKHIGSRHHHFTMDMALLESHARAFLATTDLPFADSSALAVSYLSEQTRKQVTVALSGDGADELFGGYNKHRAFILAQAPFARIARILSTLLPSSREDKLGNLSRKMKRLAQVAKIPADKRYAFLAAFSQENLIPDTNPDAFFSAGEVTGDALQHLLYLDQKLVLEGDMLEKQDRMSMRHSLEVRVPFLDLRVVAFANGLPAERKFNRKNGKRILREAFPSLLPSPILKRSKHGFEVPLESLLRTSLLDEIDRISRSTRLTGIGVDPELLRNVLSHWKNGHSDHTSLIWSLIVLDHWMDRNISSKA